MKSYLYKNIVADDKVCSGRPTLDGTRLTVQTVLSHLLAGDIENDILEAFPTLKVEDIETIKEFATLQFDPKFFAKAAG